MKYPKVSVVLPIYKAEQHIKRCITSVLSQSYQNLELILIDDGSPDKCPEICDRYADEDTRVKVIHQENGGASRARNSGILTATGKYIMFVDSDDYIDLNMVEAMVKYMEEQSLDLVTCGCEYVHYVNGETEVLKVQTYGNRMLSDKSEVYKHLYPFIDTRSFHRIWGKIYVTKTIRENKILFNEGLSVGEDFLFNLHYVDQIKSCVFIGDIFYKYYIGLNYLSNKYISDTFYQRTLILKELEKFYGKNGLSDHAVNYQYVKSAYAHCMMLFHKDCQLSRSRKLSEMSAVLEDKSLQRSMSRAQPKNLQEWVLVSTLKTKNLRLIWALSVFMNHVYKVKRYRR